NNLLFYFSVVPVNVKTLTVIKEQLKEEQQWSPGVDQEEPKPPQIKEEQEELWTSQDGQQLKKADVKCVFTSVPVKSEGGDDDDEEKPLSSQLHRSQTVGSISTYCFKSEANKDDHRGPARNFDPGKHLQPATNKTTSCSSETEDSDDGSRERQSVFSGSDLGFNAAKTVFSCSECGKRFGSSGHLQIHVKCHTGEKTSACPFCGKKFSKNSNLTTHLRVHTGEKPFTCSVCNTSFSLRCTLVNHMRVHTGEKPFSCSVCSKRFSKKANLTTHMALHTEEKPFHCSMCDRRFTWHSQIKNHKCIVDCRSRMTS
uniref:C2H2-type domain-containing protein n=1 Tax=Anabas testudineus TaxID=64144 RepID=A0AAQ6IUV0_ANATE